MFPITELLIDLAENTTYSASWIENYKKWKVGV
jgi:hypothetical protein